MWEESHEKTPDGVLLVCIQDKRLFLKSRLRESFHVLRLSNRLCRLCHTAFSLLSHGRWVHSRENNGSRVVGTNQAGHAQMCQGCWQWRQGEGGTNSEVAKCRVVKQAPVLFMAQRGETSERHAGFTVSAVRLEYY